MRARCSVLLLLFMWQRHGRPAMTYATRYCLVPHPMAQYLAANGCKTYLNLNLPVPDSVQYGSQPAGVVLQRPSRGVTVTAEPHWQPLSGRLTTESEVGASPSTVVAAAARSAWVRAGR
jgi:hypothetical protein